MNYAIKDPNATATPKQLWLLFTVGKKVGKHSETWQDFKTRCATLTKGEASAAIDELLLVAPAAPDFASVVKEAEAAAQAAAEAWLAKATPKFRVVQRANPLDDRSPVVKDFGTMLDVCGFAHIEVVDRRTHFAKWCKANGLMPVGRWLSLNYGPLRMRQELGMAEAACSAALAVFSKHGISGLHLWSRID